MNDDDIVRQIKEKRRRANQERAERAKRHEEGTKERAQEVATLRAAYLQHRDSIVIRDILTKAKMFMQMHDDVARFGEGARQGADGPQTFSLTPQERVSQLDRSAGIQELVDYIERQVKIANEKPDGESTQAEA